MSIKATALSWMIEVGRTETPGEPHLIVYAAGSPKAGRKTLCGVPRTDLQIAASQPVNSESSYMTWRALCAVCSRRADGLNTGHEAG